MDTNSFKIPFQVETKRVIEILSSEIYDSPFALLRENIQNAYDAVLMREVSEINESFTPAIQVQIDGRIIKILDNGIGMNLEVLKRNFWTAGSSGKRNNDIAQKAGVIGTFGIGAMANFGVCEILEVITSPINESVTYHSKAVRASLKIGEDCIETLKLPFNGRVGTEVIATLDPAVNFDVESCIKYIKPYVEFLPIKLSINSTLYSTRSFSKYFDDSAKNATYFFPKAKISNSGFEYSIEGFALQNSLVYVKITELSFQKKEIKGQLILFQGATESMCYRNYFGLSPIPVSRGYNLGGFINLSFLTPTAGREALSRDSIAVIESLLNSIEHQITLALADSDVSNINISFQKYIVSKAMLDYGKNITIRVTPGSDEIKVSNIPDRNKNKTSSYYVGSNQESLQMFANENNDLYLPSPSNPRRQIQFYFLNKFQVKQQGDEIQIKKIFERNELSVPEGTILFKITNIITDDYLIKDVNVAYAIISHGVTEVVRKKGDVLEIILAKDSPSITQLIHFYNVDYSVLSGFVKDYVRGNLYQKFSQYVPSATKQGADALYKILLKSRELFKIDEEDQGELDSLIADFLKGDASFEQVVKKSTSVMRAHTETVRVNQMGTIEEAIPDLVEEEDKLQLKANEGDLVFAPMPPILRLEQTTPFKLLQTTKSIKQLNDFKNFIALSDQLYKRDKDFFFQPHTTKIIWGNHKVVFIFGHISNKITLYYDIELKDKIDESQIGGTHFPTTTIITSNKIFIPIPDLLMESFIVKQKAKEFYIRYDLITDIN
jgi:molecular chaperone HtpG